MDRRVVTRRQQKIEEKLYAECASALLCESWVIQESDDEHEWPDLLISTANATFGLEVRKLYADEDTHGSRLREDESSNMSLLRQVATNYYKKDVPPVSVQFYGCPDNPNRIVEDLAIIVPSMHTWEQKKVTCGNHYWMFMHRLPDECGKYCRWKVVSDSVGWVGHIDQPVVLSAVHKKAVNLVKYKKHINDVRLLLVCDRTMNSGKYLFGIYHDIENSGFDHIYLLSYPDEIYHLPA